MTPITINHDWPDEQDATRCKWCGTVRATHNSVPQNCVPRWDAPQQARQPPEERRVYAVNDPSIHDRMQELEAERSAILNRPTETD